MNCLDLVKKNHFKSRPVILKNVANKDATLYDTLKNKAINGNVPCEETICLASLMGGTGQRGNDPRPPPEIRSQAKDFLEQYFTSVRKANSASHIARWEQVQKEITTTGTYELTETELIYGAKLAWRNSVRCIGRIQWSKLQVFDCRSVATTGGMFEALCNHIKYASNKGNIRSAITIFPQRTDGKHDFKIWNAQLISYAGYKQSDGKVLGDPQNVEFTDVCLKLGWKPARTRWEILPLVLSANGHDPDYFDIPKDLILEVELTHPTYEWFKDFGLRWYCLPAVSNMMTDCGGLQFPAAPFNGWYMSTEIGCRNLCDPHRYNMLEPIARAMGLDTLNPTNLWKDKALVECNIAVLHSFQQAGVTIVDHHTASDSFMKHLENEVRIRNGCPSDWVWIVPPMSGSITPVFHQEMALYYLKPSYEYQIPAWKTHIWKKGRDSRKALKPRRKFHFKQIARAVKFTSKLFGRALSRRIKATVLYATETGKSEGFAKKLCEVLGHAFNAQVYCMSDYDISNIEHEALLIVVTSTFGNGDPPENGEEFAKNLYALKLQEHEKNNKQPSGVSLTMATSKSFIKANSQTETGKVINRLDSWKGSGNDPISEDNFGHLSNVRFAVFGLGSSAYPNFASFGKYVDNLLGELGGERILKLATGDEMCGQEQAFRKWVPQIFKVACETFCLDDDDLVAGATASLETETLTAKTVRFVEGKAEPLREGLEKCHNKAVSSSSLLRRTKLHGSESRPTLLLQFANTIYSYQPGDHLGVFAANKPEIVDGIIKKLKGVNDPNESLELQVLEETHTANGVNKSWVSHERLPTCSVRTLLSRYLDITTPPSPVLLQHFATIATNEQERKRLELLSSDSAAYEDWRHFKFPHLLEVLEEFPSVSPLAPLLIAQLPILQPRFYSISSSPAFLPEEIHLTVAVVTYQTQDGHGPVHYGVSSNYLQDVKAGSEICIFKRSASNFYLPTHLAAPVIMVGPGTGIAPFRGFWQHRLPQVQANKKVGKMWLLFGCRTRDLDLFADEKQEMVKNKVLDKNLLALSRERAVPKTYVQDLALREATELYKLLVVEKGHVYICGDCTMAEHVYQTIRDIIQNYGHMTQQQAEKYMLSMRDENRYHEDIFGIVLRTSEVHTKSRETARQKLASES